MKNLEKSLNRQALLVKAINETCEQIGASVANIVKLRTNDAITHRAVIDLLLVTKEQLEAELKIQESWLGHYQQEVEKSKSENMEK